MGRRFWGSGRFVAGGECLASSATSMNNINAL